MNLGQLAEGAPQWGNLLAEYAGTQFDLLRPDCSLVEAARLARGHLAYLATPYSKLVLNDDLEWDRGQSLDLVLRAARWASLFALEGVTAISPIVQAGEMCHSRLEGDLDPLDHVFWTKWCAPLLAASRILLVPPVPGWDQSQGIWFETCTALSRNVRVCLIAPEQGGLS